MASFTADDILTEYLPEDHISESTDMITINTFTGATGPLTQHLGKLFSDNDQRRALRELALTGGEDELSGQWLALQRSLEYSARELLKSLHKVLLSEAVAEALGPKKFLGSSEDDEECSFQKRKFFSLVTRKETEKDYARRISQMLRLWISLLDESNRERCNVGFIGGHRDAIHQFKESARTPADIKKLILEILETGGSITTSYNKEILCLLPVAHLLSPSLNFSQSDSASKTICAIKYLCRGCVMLHCNTLPEGTQLKDVSLFKYVEYQKTGTHPFGNLVRLHCGINAMSRPILDRVRHTEGDNIYVDCVNLGLPVLLQAIRKCYFQSADIYEDLLFGFNPNLLMAPSVLDDGKELYVAFGRKGENADGNFELLRHICADPILKSRFFFGNRKLKVDAAKKYLNDCLKFEKVMAPLMHLLTGASSRATDFKQLTFRNGGPDLPRRVTLYDANHVLVDRQSRKTALLHKKAARAPALIPRSWFEHVLQYWVTIRPFATLLARGLKKKADEIVRWQRFCIVKASEKQMRDSISAVFNSGDSNFQRLRHAAEAIFRDYVLPKELDLQARHPFDALFGHSRKTGETYGVRTLTGSDESHAAADITGIRRCLKGFWTVLGLDREEAKDCTSSVGGDDSDSDSDDDSETDSNQSLVEDEVDERNMVENQSLVEDAIDEPSLVNNQPSSTRQLINNENTVMDNVSIAEDEAFEASIVSRPVREEAAVAEPSMVDNETSIEDAVDEPSDVRNETFVENDRIAADGTWEASIVSHPAREETAIAEPSMVENETSIEDAVDEPSIVRNETCIAQQIVHYDPCLVQQLHNQPTPENHNSIIDRFEDNDSTAAEEILEDSIVSPTASEEDVALLAVSKLGFSGFKSVAQKQLISQVLEGKDSVAGVLPTGSGKTLAIFVALTEQEEKATIVIYPLHSVYDDAVKRLKELSRDKPAYRNQWRCWESNVPLRELIRETRLILVNAEMALDKSFINQTRSCNVYIKRIVFDEAPLFINSSFRSGLSSLPVRLRSAVSCPFILLTATLQPSHEDFLCEGFFSPGLKFVRGPTIRPEITHQVVKLRNISMMDVSKFVEISNTSLTIVFVRSVSELKSCKAGLEMLPELTGRIEIYHGGLSSQQRLIAASSWSSGRKPLMIATTAFSHGVHDDKCRRVIHVGMPFDIDTYVQAAGRSGRDGAEAKSVILLDNRPSNMRSDFQVFLKTDRCRLAALSSLLDTPDLQWHGTCGRCDKCLAKGSVAQIISPEWRREMCSQYPSNCDSELLEQQRQARQFISRKKSAITKLLALCKQNTCFTCYALTNGRDKKIHDIAECPHWRGRCFRCGSKGCTRKSCEKSRYILDKLTQANLCITCSLPPRMFDSPIHGEQGSMGKTCIYRDTVLPLMLFMWQDQGSLRRIQAHASQSFAKFDEYISWALEDVGGVSRFHHFLVGHLGLST